MASLLADLMSGLDLSGQDARHLAEVLLAGEVSDVQAAGVLVALQIKGATGSELAGMAAALRERALSLSHDFPDLVDTCGTGGGRTTWNLSTASALVAAGAGARVAKHGNRSVTSHCGSADVLEHLGVNLHADPEQLAKTLRDVGIVFLFAPAHHSAMKNLAGVRKSLGVRTVFNQLGPLANPAGASRQLIGVYDRTLLRPMAEALVLLGAVRAFVVHGEDGLDEVSPCTPTSYCEVADGRIREGVFSVTDFMPGAASQDALSPGSTVAENAEILVEALTDRSGPRSEAVVPNAAVTLLVSGVVSDLALGARAARDAIESGAARRTLDRLIEASVS